MVIDAGEAVKKRREAGSIGGRYGMASLFFRIHWPVVNPRAPFRKSVERKAWPYDSVGLAFGKTKARFGRKGQEKYATRFSSRP